MNFLNITYAKKLINIFLKKVDNKFCILYTIIEHLKEYSNIVRLNETNQGHPK